MTATPFPLILLFGAGMLMQALLSFRYHWTQEHLLRFLAAITLGGLFGFFALLGVDPETSKAVGMETALFISFGVLRSPFTSS